MEKKKGALPPKKTNGAGRKSVYPFASLLVGEYLELNEDEEKKFNSIRAAAYQFAKAKGIRISIRTANGKKQLHRTQ